MSKIIDNKIVISSFPAFEDAEREAIERVRALLFLLRGGYDDKCALTTEEMTRIVDVMLDNLPEYYNV